ncbi:glycosyltransferase [Pseudoduganella namucuonensis]|uniref:Glycosyl transferases group 1 n=1 Tax=Pseudoduganella namucuonensis TaxID=1035707 RepID=A0A1I7HCV7_9BURK|nr:glycosyltransferase [Pseudoduganella namucuonensis]SFU58548.1 Glycosyl transferases group 1 [Pseudoduganella namucuonensis]
MLPLTETAVAAPAPGAPLPLIVHLIDRRAGDGEETSLLTLLRHMPPGRYRHMILSLRGDAEWELRHDGSTAQVIGLQSRLRVGPAGGVQPQDRGLDWHGGLRLFGALKRLRPVLVHTHSAAAQWLAAAAGVPVRLERASMAGAPRRHGVGPWLSRLFGPPPGHGAGHRAVDSVQFHPRLGPAPASVGPPGFLCDQAFVIGAAGAMDEGHGHAQLVRAFLLLLEGCDPREAPLRLLIAGDGPERAHCQALLRQAGAERLAWLPGARDDVARLMRSMDVFVAPAAHGCSGQHILEAMASGLAVVAATGGDHAQLIQAGWTGTLVPPGEPPVLANAIADYDRIPGLARRHGHRGRHHVMAHHSLAAMAARYLALYDRLLARRGG